MREALKAQMTSMMRWQSRAVLPVASLFVLSLVRFVAGYLVGASPIHGLLDMATVCALLVSVVVGAIVVCQIYHAGRMAFGVRAGLGYALLAVALLFWPGLFVIPHVVRLDIKRLLGIEPDDAETNPAEPTGGLRSHDSDVAIEEDSPSP